MPLAQGAQQCDLTPNALRIAARKGQLRAVLIRGRIFVYQPDLEQLYRPVPYPPATAA